MAAVRGAAMWAGAVLVCALTLSLASPSLGAELEASSGALGAGLVQLTFFLQEDPACTYVVVPPLDGHGGLFGSLQIIDQSVTLAPHPQSAQLGRAKGLGTFCNNAESSADEVLWSINFDDPRPFGFGVSSLSFRGANKVALPQREVSIVGGTGRFRLAKGFAYFSTHSKDPKTLVVTTTITAFVQLDPAYSKLSAEEIVSSH